MSYFTARCRRMTFWFARTAMGKTLLTGFVLLLTQAMLSEAVAQKLMYPPARKDNIVDDYHGTKVADPYRWMENADAPETQKWVAAENTLTQDFLAKIPVRAEIKARLTQLWDYPKYTAPQRSGDRYYFSKNDGLQNQYVLYMQKSLDGEPQLVLDPNKLSADGTVALTNRAFSKDGKLMAYGLSSSGSDWQEIRIREIDAGNDFPEVIHWCKFAGIGWKHDNSGFFYNRLPEPGSVAPEDQNNYSRVYWHKLGTEQAADVLVYERPDAKELGFAPFVTEDGKYVMLYVYHGTDPRNGIYYREIDSEGDFVRLLEVGDAKYDPIGNDGPVFYFLTDFKGPRGRLIAIDSRNPARENWREMVPENEDVLASVGMVNDQFVATYMHDAHHLVKIYNRDGSLAQDLALPTIGSVGGITGRREDSEMFITFSSYLYPSTVFRYDFKTAKLSQFRESGVDFDPDNYETKQIFYPSQDGTRIPMFITSKKGLVLDGKNPALLYGYGGFNISITPSFSISRLVWLERGGVYAVANLRGGDEYGEAWHQAGMLDKKQNVFDDFIAAAEWLIDNKYTSTARLAINGGSNGGLLVAACMLQRPELFGAVICQVPVTDMLRYHKFTVGRYWVPEYGNAEAAPEQFKFLFAYSPLHNIKKGVAYPPTLITTADTDDRVVPSHAKKFAATLQAADTGKNPLLIRIETKAGHGGGKPTTKVIDEQSDIYAFLWKIFGMGKLAQK